MLLVCALGYNVQAQTTITIVADRVSTIYSENANTSNGAGQNFFAGVTAQGSIRRGLLFFNLGSIPTNATITNATIRVFNNKQAGNAGGVALHKLTADWGEGTSDASANEGQGAIATMNDATWDRRSLPSAFWANLGGDFIGSLSAELAVVNAGDNTFSGNTLIADVQNSVASQATNFGWLMKATNEGTTQNALRFASEDNGNIVQRPALTITYTTNLPVTFKNFAVSKSQQNALLTWTTATEINNQYFSIEHSSNGRNFESLGKVTGHGTTTSVQHYAFAHNNIAAGKHFYRLAQYDFDGRIQYSSILLLQQAESISVQLLPNPATSTIRLIATYNVHQLNYSIVSAAGRVVVVGKVYQNSVDIRSLPIGPYYLMLQNDAGTTTRLPFLKL